MQGVLLPVLITPLGELELVNALQVRLFRKAVRRTEARAAHSAFRADLQQGVFVMRPLADEVFIRARQLASKWTARLGTRSLDILHVAAAVVLRADTFARSTIGRRNLQEPQN